MQEYEQYHERMSKAWRDHVESRGYGQMVDPRGWEIATDILKKQKQKIESFGENAYLLSEKQAALIERVLSEQEAMNTKTLAQARAEDEAAIAKQAQAKAAADSRTLEQIESDSIANEIRHYIMNESKEADRGRVKINDLEIEALHNGEVILAVRAFYYGSSLGAIDDPEFQAMVRDQTAKALDLSAEDRVALIGKIWREFHWDFLNETDEEKAKMEVRWQSILRSIADGKWGWYAQIKDFLSRAQMNVRGINV